MGVILISSAAFSDLKLSVIPEIGLPTSDSVLGLEEGLGESNPTVR